MKIFAYYYPGFFNDKYRLTGTEWELMKNAIPRNKKHYQPKKPLLGYYNQNSFDACLNQVELAEKFGIDGFMICYYWDFEMSEPIMNEPLEKLIEVIRGKKFQFNLMWVLRLPHKKLPISQGNYGKYQNHPWFKKRIQSFQNDRRFKSEIERICRHPNYRKAQNGKPLIQFYSVSELLDGSSNIKEIIEGFQNYHIQAICGRNDSWITIAEQLGIDSLSTYVTLVDFDSNRVVLNHKDCVADQESIWQKIQEQTSLPYIPSVSPGWDASPRGEFYSGFRNRKFPWAPVVLDSNPKDYYENLILAQSWALKNNVDIHISSWNEWSEGHYLEPDDKNGYEFLKFTKKIKETSNERNDYIL